jgi:hypothetical protein
MNFDIKLTCPHCGKEGHMASFKPDQEVYEIAKIAAKFGRAWPWVSEYARSFQSANDKPLKPARLKLILEEIAAMMEKGGITYDGQFYGVRNDALFAACREVALTNKTGFKNHNYLKRVAIGKNQAMINEEEKEQQGRAKDARRREPIDPGKFKEIYEKL